MKYGRQIDSYAASHPYEYPNQSQCYVVDNVEGKPLLSWVGIESGSRGNKKYRCRGIFICAHFSECLHSIRPAHPRRGSGKYAIGGQIPLPDQRRWCKLHPKEEPMYIKCRSWWTTEDLSGDKTRWRIVHEGDHDHPAPHPIHATWSKMA